MEALNSKDRTIALLKFLALFLITIILVNLAIHINTKLPDKEIAVLKDENAILKGGERNTQLWLITVDSIRNQLGRFSTDANPGRIEQEVNASIRDLNKYGVKDSSTMGTLLTRVADAYSTMLVDKKKLSLSGDCSGKIADMQKDADKMKADLKQCNDDLITRTIQLNNCIGH